MSASPPATPARHGLFARLWDRVRSVPPWVRWTLAGLLVLVLVGGGVGGAVALRKLSERQKAAAAVEQWARFDKAARSGDEAEMLAALDAITPLTADPLCDQYRDTIRSGVAPADDPKQCLLTTTLHARRGNWADASREAAKRLVHEPADWLSRCVVALAAVAAGDPKAAGEQLDKLPDPARGGPTPAGLLLAFDLFRRCDRDTTPLRRFVNDVVVDVLNSVGVADDPPAVKVELVECYLLGFTGPPDDPLPPRLGTAAAAVVRLADDAATADDPAVLTRLGTACNRLAVAVERLHQARQITVAQRDGLAKEHDARTERVWRRVKELAPKTTQAYHGLAVLEVRAKRPGKAVDEVRAGLTACGNDPTLLALYSVLLRATDRTDDALRALAKAADDDPKNLNLLLLVAETALEVPRRDVADLALRRAADLAPTDPRVIRNDVRLRLILGDAHGAVQRLRDLGETALLADPLLARVYTRSLAEAGLHVLLPDWLDRAERQAGGANKPALAAAVVRGLSEARFDPDTAKLGLTVVDRTLTRWPGDTDALVARGLLLTRWAEFGTPRWDPARTRDAAFALERVRAIVPDDPDAAAILARLRLKGLNDPSKAAKDIAPLLAARDRGGLVAPPHLAVVGMVLLANDKLDAAQAALEAAHKAGPSAAVCVHLALAYHTRGNTARGRELVAEARRLPRTPQDDADLLALPAPLRENP
jgi:predicted Zn-dependent protease